MCTIPGEGNSAGSAGDVETTKSISSGAFPFSSVSVSSPT